MFFRDEKPMLTFRVYDGWGNCISEFTGTLDEWQETVEVKLVSPNKPPKGRHLTLVKSGPFEL
jgi:hypothetical protein